MEYVVPIQQSAALIAGICYLVIIADRRDVEFLPTWYLASVVVPLIVAVVVFVIMTLVRIWS